MKGPAEMCDSEVNGQPKMSSTNENSVNQDVDFSDYMWMAEEQVEDFDKKCEDEFWEEFLMEQAYEDMLAEEEDTQTQFFPPHSEGPYRNQRNRSQRLYHSSNRGNCGPQQYPQPRQQYPPSAAAALNAGMSGLNINSGNSYQGPPSGAVQNVPSYQILQRPPHPSAATRRPGSHAPNSTSSLSSLSLNPNAPAFVPRFAAAASSPAPSNNTPASAPVTTRTASQPTSQPAATPAERTTTTTEAQTNQRLGSDSAER